MNICIIDDIKSIADMIKEVIESVSSDFEEEFVYNVFYNAEVVNNWISTTGNKVDICFLDVNLGNDENNDENIDGLIIAKKLKEINYRTLIIFISGFTNYYSKMVQVEPFRFLEKPFSDEELISVFKLAYSRYLLQNNKVSQIYKYTYNGIIHKVVLNYIKYIYSQRRKICMVNTNNEVYEFYGKLDNVESEILEISESFLRISKSYLVNTNYINSFNRNSITIDNEILNIGQKYKFKVFDVLIH